MTGFSAVLVAEDGGSDGQHWAGQARILGPKWSRFAALTVGLVGLQVFWSVEMSYASPYLLSLGLSKSHMALVFVAGPLSGLIVQPLVGLLADNSKSKFGRRRPYMIVGSFFCVFAMLLLGYTRAFANIFSSSGSTFNDALTIWLAVFAIYCMDFAINAVQAVDRALLVDTLPASEQAKGNAWAAQMLGIGGVVGFFFGEVDLTGVFGWIGETQLKILTVIASLLLIGTHGTTAVLVKERVLVSTSKPPKGLKKEMILIWQNIRTLPPVIRQICIIQFFAWIGWFPTIFYTTTYIGEIHKRASPAPDTNQASMLLDAEATRLGTRALFFSSIVSLTTNYLAPYLILSDRDRERSRSAATGFREFQSAGLFQRLRPPKMHLATLWATSHAVFAVCMMATFFIESVWAATVLILITGFSWAVTQWAPFSLIGEAILSPGADMDDTSSIRLADTRRSDMDERAQFLVASDEEDDEDVEVNSEDRPHRPPMGSRRSTGEIANGVLGNVHARQSSINIGSFGDGDVDGHKGSGQQGGDLAAKAGIILGIHNIFVVIPQFLVTALSSIIFALFEPDKSVLHGTHPGKTIPPVNGTLTTGGDAQNATAVLEFVRRAEVEAGVNSVAVIFRIGGFAALVACALTWRLARELNRPH